MPRRVTTPTQTRLIFGFGPASRLAAESTPGSVSDERAVAAQVSERPAEPPLLTVTQCNQRAKMMLEKNFSDIDVEGEVSNFRPDRSGHCWFALKDAGGVLSAVLFRREAARLTRPLADGVLVIATGTLTIYPATGRYQLVIKKIRLAGTGALQAAFEALRLRLASEGLFDTSRKCKLPLVPGCVAVITSSQGAVLQDILNVGLRRWPRAQILVVPVRVQGPECAMEVAQAIGRVGALAQSHNIDVVIVARGGGSLEDLFGFNDERVARALAACPIPTVSAIGHESDTTIADWVADVRAPTPSVAAELVFPERAVWIRGLEAYRTRLTQALRRTATRARQRLATARARLGDGKRALWPERQRLAVLEHRLEMAQRRHLARLRHKQNDLERRLARRDPKAELASMKNRLQAAHARLVQKGPAVLAQNRARLESVRVRLLALSPLEVLGRGYSITLSARGEAIRDADSVRVGETVTLRFSRGSRRAEVAAEAAAHASDP